MEEERERAIRASPHTPHTSNQIKKVSKNTGSANQETLKESYNVWQYMLVHLMSLKMKLWGFLYLRHESQIFSDVTGGRSHCLCTVLWNFTVNSLKFSKEVQQRTLTVGGEGEGRVECWRGGRLWPGEHRAVICKSILILSENWYIGLILLRSYIINGAWRSLQPWDGGAHVLH